MPLIHRQQCQTGLHIIRVNPRIADQFRLQKVSEIQSIMKAESDKRVDLAKKFQRGINILSRFEYNDLNSP